MLQNYIENNSDSFWGNEQSREFLKRRSVFNYFSKVYFTWTLACYMEIIPPIKAFVWTKLY